MSKTEMISVILENRAAEQGERPAYIFLSYGETGVVEERLTYAELDARARAIGASLQAAGAGASASPCFSLRGRISWRPSSAASMPAPWRFPPCRRARVAPIRAFRRSAAIPARGWR